MRVGEIILILFSMLILHGCSLISFDLNARYYGDDCVRCLEHLQGVALANVSYQYDDYIRDRSVCHKCVDLIYDYEVNFKEDRGL